MYFDASPLKGKRFRPISRQSFFQTLLESIARITASYRYVLPVFVLAFVMSLADYEEVRGLPIALQDSETSSGMDPTADDDSDKEVLKDPITTKITLMDITERERPYGDRPSITPTSFFNQAKDIDKKYNEYALLLRRKVDKDSNRRGTDLEIWSAIIRGTLKTLLSDCTYLNLVACPIIIPQPYHALFHYRDEIRSHTADPSRREDEKRHLDVLIKFMDANLLKTEREYNRHILNDLTTFSLLWTIFRPETIVVFDTEMFKECYRVINCQEGVSPSGEPEFQISVWSWQYNGLSFGPSKSKLAISGFQGTKEITDLNVYPLDALAETERSSLMEELIYRGKKWRGLVDKSHKEYSGNLNLRLQRREFN